jgi:hypothetical protein
MGDPYDDEERDAAEQVMGDDLLTRQESGSIPEGATGGAAQPDHDPDAEDRGPVDQPPEETDPEGTAP